MKIYNNAYRLVLACTFKHFPPNFKSAELDLNVSNVHYTLWIINLPKLRMYFIFGYWDMNNILIFVLLLPIKICHLLKSKVQVYNYRQLFYFMWHLVYFNYYFLNAHQQKGIYRVYISTYTCMHSRYNNQLLSVYLWQLYILATQSHSILIKNICIEWGYFYEYWLLFFVKWLLMSQSVIGVILDIIFFKFIYVIK